MNTIQDAPHPIENVEELLIQAFGNPTPPTEEILRHKWLESEKAGQDIGFEKALLDWVIKYRSAWRKHRQPQAGAPQLEGQSN